MQGVDFIYDYADCHYADCRYADCHVAVTNGSSKIS
jgi:hypothetical protein